MHNLLHDFKSQQKYIYKQIAIFLIDLVKTFNKVVTAFYIDLTRSYLVTDKLRNDLNNLEQYVKT